MTSSSAPSAELHPRIRELLDYLDVHRREFYAAVASVPAKLREMKPGEGRWSVAEVMEHVSLIEGRVAGLLAMRVAEARANGVGADPETSSVVASYPNPAAVVDRTNKIAAPKPVVPTGTLDSVAGSQALEKSRAALVAALRSANGVSLENLMQTHPVLGPLNLYHWMVAAALHDDRHAAQIREVRDSLAAR
jgi:hypothetical protein